MIFVVTKSRTETPKLKYTQHAPTPVLYVPSVLHMMSGHYRTYTDVKTVLEYTKPFKIAISPLSQTETVLRAETRRRGCESACSSWLRGSLRWRLHHHFGACS